MRPSSEPWPSADRSGQVAIREQLRRLTDSRHFKASRRLRELLGHLVERALADGRSRITQHQIAEDFFRLGERFDPEENAIVRVEMGKLRRALSLYYAEAGQSDSIVVEIPTGTYLPSLRCRAQEVQKHHPGLHFHSGQCPRPTIAVVPFTRLGVGGDDAFLGESLAEELVVLLSKIPEFQVVRDLPTAAAMDRIGVHYVLSGAVRRVGQRVRVTAHVRDTVFGRQLWSERFHCRADGDLLEVESDVARQICSRTADMHYGAIRRSLMKQVEAVRVAEPEVYRGVLSFYDFITRHTPDAYLGARQTLDSAVAVQPNDPLLMAMRSDVLRAGDSMGFSSEPIPTDLTLGMSQKALALAPENTLCRMSVCVALLKMRKKSALRIALEPVLSDRVASSWAAEASVLLAFSGKWRRGREILEAQLETLHVHPHYARYPAVLDAYRQGCHEEALAFTDEFSHPEMFWQPMLRAAVLGQLNREDEAAAAMAKLLQLKPDFPVRGRHYLASYLMDDGLIDCLFEGLRKAGLSD